MVLSTLSLFATTAIAESSTGTEKMWATATSKHRTNGRAIVFRYVKAYPKTFTPEAYPTRVIIAWKYQSQSGMPSTTERERMERLEDLLQPVVEQASLASLALVSTGENLREWTYYTRSEEQFFAKLNQAFSNEPPFPIEIHIAPDPDWRTYKAFVSGVRE